MLLRYMSFPDVSADPPPSKLKVIFLDLLFVEADNVPVVVKGDCVLDRPVPIVMLVTVPPPLIPDAERNPSQFVPSLNSHAQSVFARTKVEEPRIVDVVGVMVTLPVPLLHSV